jgi:hypothetical protein
MEIKEMYTIKARKDKGNTCAYTIWKYTQKIATFYAYSYIEYDNRFEFKSIDSDLALSIYYKL